MSDYSFSDAEVAEITASQYDEGGKNERTGIIALLYERRNKWIAMEPGNAMTFARADECKQIIDAILGEEEVAI